jgi:outer membrane protein assembly factor BamA
MSPRFHVSKWFVLLWMGGAVLMGVPVAAQSAEGTAARPAADTSAHPNQQPYTTDRSVAYHVLAAPAYVLHGLTRPVGWAVRYAERRFPMLFEGRLPSRGAIPLADFGGPVQFMGGALLYDNQLFGSDHEARVEGLYGSGNAFRFNGAYQWPDPFGSGTDLDLRANYFSNPDSRFFLGGNASDQSTDAASFVRRQLDATAQVEHRLPETPLGGRLTLRYEHVDADGGSGTRGARLTAANPPGLQSVHLLTPQLIVGLSRTNEERRPSLGTEVLLQLGYTHDLTDTRFRYGRYVAELRQYLPVLLFPKSRRLVLRARLEQAEPLFGGAAVPFYHLPSLGGQTALRGFRHNRFQDTGSLVLNAEYRYPIWSNLDAVAFVDAGQVFPELSAVTADRLHWSYGGGVHLLNSSGISFRFEVAGSTEGVRTILTVEPSFRRVPR